VSTRHTTNRMKVFPIPPTNLGMLPISPSPPYWTPSEWIEIFAHTPAKLYVTGLSFDFIPRSFASLEIEFGIGAVGQEVSIHVYRAELLYDVNSQNHWIWFEVPLGNIPADKRLAVRFCSEHISAPTARFNIMYYENLISDHKSVAPASCFPFRNYSFYVPWNPGIWVNTDWVEITPGEEKEFTFTSIHTSPNYSLAAEIDLAIGTAGQEQDHIILTKRFWSSGGGNFTHVITLSAGYPIYPLNRVSFRIRKNLEIIASPLRVSFNIIRNTTFLS